MDMVHAQLTNVADADKSTLWRSEGDMAAAK